MLSTHFTFLLHYVIYFVNLVLFHPEGIQKQALKLILYSLLAAQIELGPF